MGTWSEFPTDNDIVLDIMCEVEELVNNNLEVITKNCGRYQYVGVIVSLLMKGFNIRKEFVYKSLNNLKEELEIVKETGGNWINPKTTIKTIENLIYIINEILDNKLNNDSDDIYDYEELLKKNYNELN